MSNTQLEKSKPASFYGLFVLMLPPLLGVSTHFGSAFFFVLSFCLVVFSTTFLTAGLRDHVGDSALFASALVLSVVLVTVLDLLFSTFLPNTRTDLGIYLNLLALSPLVLSWTLERTRDQDLSAAVVEIGGSVFQLSFALLLLSLVREVLGSASLSLVRETLIWKIPFGDWFQLPFVAAASGAFLLAGVGVVLARLIRPELRPVKWTEESPQPIQKPSRPAPEVSAREPSPSQPEPVVMETVPQPIPDDIEPETTPGSKVVAWGESLESILTKLGDEKSLDKKRILVIGSGSGELVWYTAMLGLEVRKKKPSFQFRVRGVDNFSARIEGAQEGTYREHQMDFIPLELKQAYLLRSREGDKHLVKVAEEPRLHVEWEVADFLQGRVFFHKPCHFIVLDQPIDYLSEEKKLLFIRQIEKNLVFDGAFLLRTPLARGIFSENFRRTGEQAYRKK